MRIGILGTGAVGQTLGAGLAALGHAVKIGTREPGRDKVREWVGRTARASAGSFAEAAAFSDLAVLATNWGGTENAIALAVPANLAGKVVIDVTNPLTFGPDGVSLAIAHSDSGGEQVQRWLPEARVVKAFNAVNAAHMVQPQFPGGAPDLFICGNDGEAKRAVTELATTLGWPGSIDIGGIERSRLLEPLALLYIHLGVTTGDWNHAFKLLHKQALT